MAYHDILSKLSRALAAYIATAEDPSHSGLAENVYPAKTATDKAAPCTICAATTWKLPQLGGPYICDATIYVKTLPPGDPPPAEDAAGEAQPDLPVASDLRAAATFDLFFTGLDSAGDKLADLVTAAARALAVSDPEHNADLAQFTVLDIRPTSGDINFETNPLWNDSLSLEAVCVPFATQD